MQGSAPIYLALGEQLGDGQPLQPCAYYKCGFDDDNGLME